MNLIVCLIAGVVIGCLANLAMKTGAPRDILENVLVGVVGAFLGYLGTPLFSAIPVGQHALGMSSVVVASLAAAILLIVVKLLRRAGATW